MSAKLYLLLLTYAESMKSPRKDYAEKTLRSTLDNLKFSGPVSVHIADDGSPQEYRDWLVDIAGGYPQVQGVTVTNAERRGYGASYNLATQVVHTWADIVLPLEDDWMLPAPLSIDSHVETLTQDKIQCIRLGYLGFTKDLIGTVGSQNGQVYLLLDPDSPERHVSAGHPRLETVQFERNVGPWEEGVDPGMTEHLWCGRPGARRGVAWIMGSPLDGYYKHIGSVQARTDQYVEAVS